MVMIAKELEKLAKWFLEIKRDLPWRINPTPYGVWVSEVMLQQTQVAVVVPYYLRWMERFPTIKDLASASIDDVVKEWEGLGYYSRARNLHQGARDVVENFGGFLPDTADQLQQIKGIGPYTVGAILSFAFHRKAVAVDGNVLRVLARYFQISEDIAKAKTIKSMQALAHSLLPDEEPWVINEALIELGATLCGRAPKCQLCPLKKSCKGHLAGNAVELPIKTRGKLAEKLMRAVAVIMCDDHVLVRQCLEGEIMAGLHEFPYVDRSIAFSLDETHLLFRDWHHSLTLQQMLAEERHTFTRYRAHLFPAIYHSSERFLVEGYKWISVEELSKLAFSSGHRRVLGQLIAFIQLG